MTLGACKLTDCTFNVTHQCVQAYAIEECPNRGAVVAVLVRAGSESGSGDLTEIGNEESSDAPAIGVAVLNRPIETPRLPRSGTLGIDEANCLMSDRYTSMIGIVGLPGSGKTACLVSAYLLLARGQFSGFSYANSLTLMAFEEIARGSRRWNFGDTPMHMTVHTEMADDREAGFLHLRLCRDEDGKFFDLLLPDLPGEWSRALIDQNDAARFEFLKSAAVIWMMVDGRQFTELKTRGYATYRAQCLIERLADILPTPRPRIMLVPSWKDIGEFPASAYDAIYQEGQKWGMHILLAPIASFSENDAINPGEGLAQLVEKTISHNHVAPAFWPDQAPSNSVRSFLAFRNM